MSERGVRKENVGHMNFGQAISAMRDGESVRRAGWNGKGMHIYLEDWADNRKYEPVIVMFTADKKHQPGWLASQADMLAEDWERVLDLYAGSGALGIEALSRGASSADFVEQAQPAVDPSQRNDGSAQEGGEWREGRVQASEG